MGKDMCPICQNAADVVADRFDVFDVRCPTCGAFEITLELCTHLRHQRTPLLPYLSAATRQGQRVKLTTKNWNSLAEGHRYTSVLTKLNKLLTYLGATSRRPGDAIHFSGNEYPLFDAMNGEEVGYLLRTLRDRGDLVGPKGGWVVTAQGWERLEPTSGIPGRCFVAMWFDASLDDVWARGIYPALKEDCHLDPVRIDKQHHNEKICDRIIAEIRHAQLLVADFTGHRGGVYFEAGFALGLGRPVIWMCREGEIETSHFDVRQYNHIVWSTPAALRVQLRDRVKATIPLPVPA